MGRCIQWSTLIALGFPPGSADIDLGSGPGFGRVPPHLRVGVAGWALPRSLWGAAASQSSRGKAPVTRRDRLRPAPCALHRPAGDVPPRGSELSRSLQPPPRRPPRKMPWVALRIQPGPGAVLPLASPTPAPAEPSRSLRALTLPPGPGAARPALRLSTGWAGPVSRSG